MQEPKEPHFEINDLNVIIETIESYKKSLIDKGRCDDDSKQTTNRMLIEKAFHDWFKFYGEW